MSIKIYEAYRVPVSRLNEFMGYCRATVYQHLESRMFMYLTFYGDIPAAQEKAENSPYWKDADAEKRKWMVLYQAVQNIIKQIDSDPQVKNDIDIEASLNIWLDDKYAYDIPYGIRGRSYPNWAEDYSYQNQVDRPEHISAQTYGARCRKWEKLCLNDWNATRMNHKIASFDLGFYDTEMWMENYVKEHPDLLDVYLERDDNEEQASR